MTTDPTERALLAAIADNPEEDDPRLRYADYLDEQDVETVVCLKCHGKTHTLGSQAERGPYAGYYPKFDCSACKRTGTILDTTKRDRAEFIRVQLEIERHPKCTQPHGKECYFFASDFNPHCHSCVLKTRSNNLEAMNRNKWLRVPCPDCEHAYDIDPDDNPVLSRCRTCDGTGDLGGLFRVRRGPSMFHVGDHPVGFKRGFPYALGGCRRVDVFRQYCSECGGYDNICCKNPCHGEAVFKPTAWALSVFTYHPTIRRVPLSDLPCDTPYVANAWIRGGILPDFLFHKVLGHSTQTTAHAADALATAVADILRDAAKELQ